MLWVFCGCLFFQYTNTYIYIYGGRRKEWVRNREWKSEMIWRQQQKENYSSIHHWIVCILSYAIFTIYRHQPTLMQNIHTTQKHRTRVMPCTEKCANRPPYKIQLWRERNAMVATHWRIRSIHIRKSRQYTTYCIYIYDFVRSMAEH